MFSSFHPLSSIKFGFGRWVASSSSKIDLPSVTIHDTEHSDTSKRSRRLKHLLKLNHVNHAILFNNRRFHNHTPHILGSGYILAGDADHLNAIYDAEAASGLVPWEDSPGEIAMYDWRDFLGRREYERAFVDFFEDQLVLRGYEWRAVVGEFLLESKEPLINNLISGLGHPLIHLGYAYELNSKEVAMEALGLAATNYNHMHKYLDDPKYSQVPTQYQTSSPLEILARVNEDKRLDGLFSEPGGSNLDDLFHRHESIVLEHWNAWKITDPKAQFEQTQQAAVAILISAAAQQSPPSPSQQQNSSSPPPPLSPEKASGAHYDFYLLHLLTTSHAVRILLPILPAQHHVPLLRQWFLLTVALYIAQLRPAIDVKSHILDYDVRGRDWVWVVEQQALRGRHALDSHYVKGIRAIKEARDTWGDATRKGDGEGEAMQDFYLKAAVRFAGEFDGWGGFSAAEVEEEREKEKEEMRRRREDGSR